MTTASPERHETPRARRWPGFDLDATLEAGEPPR
jgi:hypothetical protein